MSKVILVVVYYQKTSHKFIQREWTHKRHSLANTQIVHIICDSVHEPLSVSENRQHFNVYRIFLSPFFFYKKHRFESVFSVITFERFSITISNSFDGMFHTSWTICQLNVTLWVETSVFMQWKMDERVIFSLGCMHWAYIPIQRRGCSK